MTGPDQPGDEAYGEPDADTAELIAQIRQLAGADPSGVREVVVEVLAALDRVAGGALRDQLPEGIRLDARFDAPVAGSG